MSEVLVMTGEEARRLYVIQQVIERKIRQRPAAELLDRSVRQIRRLVRRIRQEGPRGMGHRLRGRQSNRRAPERLRQRVVRLYQAPYADFGPTLAREKLAARHRLRVGRETLRRWLGPPVSGPGRARRRAIISGGRARPVAGRWSKSTGRIMIGWKAAGRASS